MSVDSLNAILVAERLRQKLVNCLNGCLGEQSTVSDDAFSSNLSKSAGDLMQEDDMDPVIKDLLLEIEY